MNQTLLFIIVAFLFANSIGYSQEKDDVIFKAMADEIERSKAKLQMEKLEKPYYIEYTIADMDQFNADASFGGITNTQRDRRRFLKVGVRVGDYHLDNTNFFSSSTFGTFYQSARQIPVDDNYDAIRHALWLATDQAYKNALESVAKKRAYVKNIVSIEKIDDFSKEQPTTSVTSRVSLDFNEQQWVQTIKDYSAIFRKYPKINNSNVYSRISSVQKYFLNSEGFKYRQPQTIVGLVVVASTQAPDGMQLRDFISFYAKSLQEFPTAREVTSAIEKLATDLSQALEARVLNFYTGPVLLTGQASAEFFRQMLGKNLSGTRPPMVDNKQWERMLQETEFKNKLKMKVLPDFISVTDNPLRTSYNKKLLIGSYTVDDEGVPAQEVRLVENGVLKNFLMSRVPRKEFSNSNGHGRAPISSGAEAKMGNLFVLSSKTKSYDELKRQLLDMCKQQDKEYGIIVKVLDNPALTGESRGFSPYSWMTDPSAPKLTAPLLVYKVYVKDGREELVRGVEFGDITVRSLKDIIATGNDYYVHNFMNMAGSGYPAAVTFLPTSIVAPSILIEEMDLKKVSGEQQKPPLLAHPFFAE